MGAGRSSHPTITITSDARAPTRRVHAPRDRRDDADRRRRRRPRLLGRPLPALLRGRVAGPLDLPRSRPCGDCRGTAPGRRGAGDRRRRAGDRDRRPGSRAQPRGRRRRRRHHPLRPRGAARPLPRLAAGDPGRPLRRHPRSLRRRPRGGRGACRRGGGRPPAPPRAPPRRRLRPRRRPRARRLPGPHRSGPARPSGAGDRRRRAGARQPPRRRRLRRPRRRRPPAQRTDRPDDRDRRRHRRPRRDRRPLPLLLRGHGGRRLGGAGDPRRLPALAAGHPPPLSTGSTIE